MAVDHDDSKPLYHRAGEYSEAKYTAPPPDYTRHRLALLIVGGFVIIVAGLVITMVVTAMLGNELTSLTQILSLVFGGMGGLAGSVAGFYFGRENTDSDSVG